MPRGKQIINYHCYLCRELVACVRVENKKHNVYQCETCDDKDRCCDVSINLQNYTHKCGGYYGKPQLATIED